MQKYVTKFKNPKKKPEDSIKGQFLMGRIIFKDPRLKIAFKDWLKAPNVFEKRNKDLVQGISTKSKKWQKSKKFLQRPRIQSRVRLG